MEREEDRRDRLFLSEWELEEWEKKQKKLKRKSRRKEGIQLKEEEERRDIVAYGCCRKNGITSGWKKSLMA